MYTLYTWMCSIREESKCVVCLAPYVLRFGYHNLPCFARDASWRPVTHSLVIESPSLYTILSFCGTQWHWSCSRALRGKWASTCSLFQPDWLVGPWTIVVPREIFILLPFVLSRSHVPLYVCVCMCTRLCLLFSFQKPRATLCLATLSIGCVGDAGSLAHATPTFSPSLRMMKVLLEPVPQPETVPHLCGHQYTQEQYHYVSHPHLRGDAQAQGGNLLPEGLSFTVCPADSS